MKLNKIFLSGLAMLACLTASAQEQPGDKVENVFIPHFYVQGQIGGQYTLGEIGFSKLLAPNAQVGVGYEFNPAFGLRFSVNGWQSKGGWDLKGEGQGIKKWKYNYVSPMIDATFNLSNVFAGYNPNRLFNLSALIGGGINIAWNNDDACKVQGQLIDAAEDGVKPMCLQYLWDGTKVRGVGRAGLAADFRVSDKVSIGLEATANVTTDHYNSKKAGNPDWYFNALVGVKYNIGKTHKTRVIPAPKPQEKVVERVVEKVVEKPAPAARVEKKVAEPIRRDIFFKINQVAVASSEAQKVKDIADYLNANPNAKVTVTGYADAGTGNAKINGTLAKKRAQSVADQLQNKYGISASRISVGSKGDSIQPFASNDRNRVVIAVAE